MLICLLTFEPLGEAMWGPSLWPKETKATDLPWEGSEVSTKSCNSEYATCSYLGCILRYRGVLCTLCSNEDHAVSTESSGASAAVHWQRRAGRSSCRGRSVHRRLSTWGQLWANNPHLPIWCMIEVWMHKTMSDISVCFFPRPCNALLCKRSSNAIVVAVLLQSPSV